MIDDMIERGKEEIIDFHLRKEERERKWTYK